jgi:transcriptional regulator with XRE-family HTH domain
MTQERLGELADLHRTYISDIERGERNASIMNVWRLAEAMGITVCDLCQGWDSSQQGLSKPKTPLEKETFVGKPNDHGLKIDIRYDPGEFLVLKTVGTIDERTMPPLFMACSTAQRKYNCNRYLADFRQSRLRLNTGDISRVPMDLQRHGITGHRASLLFSRIGEDERFLETVCAEAGVAARMFVDTSEALSWLRRNLGSATRQTI